MGYTVKHDIVQVNYITFYAGFELPQINYGGCNGKKYSYVYAVSADWTAVSVIVLRPVMSVSYQAYI